ncbi:MAG TPA: hypothetical protein VFS21_00060 [Roseiflexaceae bacterium]|nr:hypothetical protein [Roseiflexaceae bacterium]
MSRFHRLHRTLRPRRPTLGALMALLVALWLASPALVGPARAQETTPTATPATDAPQDTPPADLLNPFPASPTMTDTVQLVLDQYLEAQNPAPAAPETQATAGKIYLPLVIREGMIVEPPLPGQPGEPTRPPSKADIAVTIWPAPSILAPRGSRITYELRVRNYADKGDAERIEVTIPYNRSQMRPVASTLDRTKGDWVSSVTDREVVVTFGPLDRQSSRTGKLVFEVGGTLANGTILDVRPSYTWVDERGVIGPQPSNWAPVVIANGPSNGAWVWTQVTPASGPAGTTHTFLSNRFIPGEGVVTWLNTPRGVQPLDLKGVADNQGSISLAFASTGLTPGTYQLVLYGMRSQLTGVATFTVR